MKPRLLIITNRLVVGGISNDIIPLAYYLKNNFDILILYGEKEKDEIEADFLLRKYPGIILKKIAALQKQFNPIKDIAAFRKIEKEIINFKADIVHTHGAKSGLIGRLTANKNKVPVIIHTYHGHHFHSYYNKIISSLISKLEKKLALITTSVIAISAWQKKELTEIYKIVPSEKATIISLGIENSYNKPSELPQRLAFRKKYSIDDNAIAIGIAGRIVAVKNLKLFIQVADSLLKSTSKKLCFFIIGDGHLKKQLKKQCDSLNLSYSETPNQKASLIFTSWIEDIIPAIQAMDIVTLTSYNEGTPMSLMEAQFCGKPVVATNVGGVRDTLVDGETGFLVEPDDGNAMVEKLRLLIEDNALRELMGKKALLFAKENFSKQAEVGKYKQLYTSLLAEKKNKHSVNYNIPIE